MLKAAAMHLCYSILRAAAVGTSDITRISDSRFQHFEDMAQRHFKDKWRLDDYAKQIGITVRQLTRICREATGMSPGDYLQSVLMREACCQLVYTRSNVTRIGHELGFEDPSYFSRAFRRHLGCTPKQYRNRFDQM